VIRRLSPILAFPGRIYISEARGGEDKGDAFKGKGQICIHFRGLHDIGGLSQSARGISPR